MSSSLGEASASSQALRTGGGGVVRKSVGFTRESLSRQGVLGGALGGGGSMLGNAGGVDGLYGGGGSLDVYGGSRASSRIGSRAGMATPSPQDAGLNRTGPDLAVYGVGESGGANMDISRPVSRGRHITGSTRRTAPYQVSGDDRMMGRPRTGGGTGGGYTSFGSGGSRPGTSSGLDGVGVGGGVGGSGLAGGLSSARRGRSRQGAAPETVERMSLSRGGARGLNAPSPSTGVGRPSTQGRRNESRGGRRKMEATNVSLEDYLLGPTGDGTGGGFSGVVSIDIPEDPITNESSIEDGDLSPSALPTTGFRDEYGGELLAVSRHDLRPATAAVDLPGTSKFRGSGDSSTSSQLSHGLGDDSGMYGYGGGGGGGGGGGARTREVDLSSLSAELFSPKKVPAPRGRSLSARMAGEDGGWELDRPPSRQRPPPENLHLFGIGKRIMPNRYGAAARPTTSHVSSRPDRPMSGPSIGRPPTRNRGGDEGGGGGDAPQVERRPPTNHRLPDASNGLAPVRGRSLGGKKASDEYLFPGTRPGKLHQKAFRDIYASDSDGD